MDDAKKKMFLLVLFFAYLLSLQFSKNVQTGWQVNSSTK
jgi:hypothetical protein